MNEDHEEPIPLKEQPPEEEDYKEKYFRLLAEMENTRKRMQKERQEMTRFAIENVISEILVPIDMFENALGFTQKMSQEVRHWAQGFEMILAQFKDILSQHNVVPFHAKGFPFDAHKHEAIEVEETLDHPEGTILEEFLKGYRSGDRTLRPARVKVAKKPTKKSEEEPKE